MGETNERTCMESKLKTCTRPRSSALASHCASWLRHIAITLLGVVFFPAPPPPLRFVPGRLFTVLPLPSSSSSSSACCSNTRSTRTGERERTMMCDEGEQATMSRVESGVNVSLDAAAEGWCWCWCWRFVGDGWEGAGRAERMDGATFLIRRGGPSNEPSSNCIM